MEKIKNMQISSVEEKASYGIGHQMGDQLKGSSLSVNVEALFRGIAESLENKAPIFSLEEMTEAVKELYTEADKKRAQEFEYMKEEGVTFLKENAERKEVFVTDSGLQYEFLTEAEEGAEKPSENSTVTVHYAGSLTTGKEFDSSIKRGEPATFPLNGVIPGWTEGLQLISKGQKARLYIPAELGYGERGAGDVIPPHSALIFDIELIDIK
ncbi:MAG: FKBP-type peptidyl-prolyl cis-trans isomerase [Psittacicella sp.]